jgi:hypothetical protein
MLNFFSVAMGFHLVTQLIITSIPFVLIFILTAVKIGRDWVVWTEAILMYLSTLLFVPYWGSSVKALGGPFTASLFVIHTLGVAIFSCLIILSIKKKNVEFRYAANMVFICMLILCLFPVGIYVDSPEDFYGLGLRRDDISGEFEQRANAAQISNELEFLQHAQDALSRDDAEAAYRLLENLLISKHEKVRQEANQLILKEPIIYKGAFETFQQQSLKESIRIYGDSARGLELQRLSIYKHIASEQDYSKAQRNFDAIFGKDSVIRSK